MIRTTQCVSSGQRLTELHRRAAEALGFTVAELMTARFTLDDPSLVQVVFPTAQVYVRHDAFVFPTAKAAMRYYASAQVDQIEDLPTDGSHRARLLPLVEAQIREIIEREGVFRMPKSAGCFVAEG